MPEEEKLTPEQLEYQDYARRWLAENRPPPPPVRLPITALETMLEEQRSYLHEWQSKCYHAGLVGADLPTEYGGGGHTGFQRIADEEMGRSRPISTELEALSDRFIDGLCALMQARRISPREIHPRSRELRREIGSRWR